MTLRLRAAARTDVGLRRDNNEDALYVGRRLVAVADGMGGQAFGEVASRVAIHTVARLDEASGPDPLSDLRDAIADANEQLRAMIAGDDELDGMGTTLTVLLDAGGRLAIAHIGDSRAYLLRDGELRQVSHDHSLVQGLVDAGQITAEEAAVHPGRSVITKALDGHDDVDADLGLLEARLGDRFLLCSDGLTDVVSNDTIAEALTGSTREEACDRLVELALRAGGPDNVSVVVADVVDDATDPEPGGVLLGSADDTADDTAVAPPDTAAGRAAGLWTRRAGGVPGRLRMHSGPGRRVAVVLAGAVVVAGLAVLAVFWYSRSQYYVGISPTQTVAIYRGVPGGLLGVDLSSLHTSTDVPVAALPESDLDNLRNGIGVPSLTAAQTTVATLRRDGCTNYARSHTRTVRRRDRATGKARTVRVPIHPAWCRG